MKQSGKKKSIRFYQRLAALTLCVLIVLTVSAEAARTPAVYMVKLPKNACHVKERWKGEDQTRTIIHVQDAHNNLDAQLNLAKTIQYLVAENQIDLVGVEGASTEIKADALRAFPDAWAREAATDWFIEDGILTGSEKSLITSPVPFRLVGVEEEEVFHKNLRAFYGTQLKRDDIIKQINEIEQILGDLKAPIYNEELKLFDSAVEDWQSGKMPFTEYIFELDHYIHETNIEVYDFIHYAAFYEALKIRSRVPEITLASEYQTLEQIIEEQTASIEEESERVAELEKYQRIHAQFRDKELDEKDYVEFLMHTARHLGIDFNTFRVLNDQLKYLQAFARVDMGQVLNDVAYLTDEVKARLAKTPDEKALVKRAKHIRLFRNLASLEALEADVNYLRQNAEEFTFSYFHAFIKEAAVKYQVAVSMSETDQGMDKIQKYILHFYQGAEMRNALLVKNTLLEMERTGRRVSVLVTGGFHTEGITGELKKQGISYAVVAPRIDSLDRTVPYHDKMMGNTFGLSSHLLSTITLQKLAEDQRLQSVLLALMQLLSSQNESSEGSSDFVAIVNQASGDLLQDTKGEGTAVENIGKMLRQVLFAPTAENPIYLMMGDDFEKANKSAADFMRGLAAMNPNGIKIITAINDDTPREKTVFLATNEDLNSVNVTEEGPITFVMNPADPNQKAMVYMIGIAMLKAANEGGDVTALGLLEKMTNKDESNKIFIGLSTVVENAIKASKEAAAAKQAA